MPDSGWTAGRIDQILRFENHKNPSSDKNFCLELHLRRNQRTEIIFFSNIPKYSEFLIEGDIVAVTGQPASDLLLLAPHTAPLPLRHYNPELLKHWGGYLASVRSFFTEQDFIEVRTPSLVPCPGTEPSLDVFSTHLKIGSHQQKLFLPTSPELHLKKALALGAEKIFEIAPCFRNGERTERHQPEFLMLEWYRAYENLRAIRTDIVSLINRLSSEFALPPPQAVRSFTVAELFLKYCDFELQPTTSKEELAALAQKLKVDVHSAESIDDFFFLIFGEKIESQLPPEELIFVEKYPPYQAALARLTSDGWGDRFEVYWKGMELANAFHELNDPTVQRQRALEDLEKKVTAHKEAVFLDEEFFTCLEAGMPPSSGIALGLERLFMALFDKKSLRDLRLFPI